MFKAKPLRLTATGHPSVTDQQRALIEASPLLAECVEGLLESFDVLQGLFGDPADRYMASGVFEEEVRKAKLALEMARGTHVPG